ncbi:hypothetical protein BDQ17DRAFT_613465 [Cyathus striatus]|nr:hypothetical protein BDQ17DRAFT_613465 [Cyathus striatus]
MMLSYITLNVGAGSWTSKHGVHRCLKLTPLSASTSLAGTSLLRHTGGRRAIRTPTLTTHVTSRPSLRLPLHPTAFAVQCPPRSTLYILSKDYSAIVHLPSFNAFPAHTVLEQPTLVERVKSHLDSISVFHSHADSSPTTPILRIEPFASCRSLRTTYSPVDYIFSDTTPTSNHISPVSCCTLVPHISSSTLNSRDRPHLPRNCPCNPGR